MDAIKAQRKRQSEQKREWRAKRTVEQKEAQREKDARRKRLQRARMTKQQRDLERAKDAERKAERRKRERQLRHTRKAMSLKRVLN